MESIALVSMDGGTSHEGRMTAEEMDEKRKQNIAYEYLCHLEEAKVWIEACINESLPPTTELEEALMNGVYFAKLGHFFSPEAVSLKKIYDKDQTRYKATGLHFRHTDNLNHFFKAMEHIGFPKLFHPETTDIYDRKNMPRVIYCVHGLSLYLFKLGIAPQIEDLYGKIKFTEEEISAMRKELDKYGLQMPAFSKIGGILTNEMPVDEAAIHAAVIAINEAIDNQDPEETLSALTNNEAHLVNVNPEYRDDYQDQLYDAKQSKAEVSRNKSLDLDATYEPDVYDELLTQAEIQGNVNKVNTQQALNNVNTALEKGDKRALLEAMKSKFLGLKNVADDKIDFYFDQLQQERQNKQNNNIDDEDPMLDKDELQAAINEANLIASVEYQKTQAVYSVNRALDEGDPNQVVKALKNPAAQLPPVHDFAGPLYLEEFSMIKNEKQADLAHNELHGGVRVLSAIAKINEAVEAGSAPQMFHALRDPFTHIEGLDEVNEEKYLVKMQDARSAKMGEPCDLLNHMEIQECIDMVNGYVKEENETINAIGFINEAVDKGDPAVTLECLQVPQAKLTHVDPKQATHYQDMLADEKKKKAEEFEDDTTVLWLDEIQNAITAANEHREEAEKMSVNVAAINLAVDQEDSQQLLQMLTSKDLALNGINAKCADAYLKELLDAKAHKESRELELERSQIVKPITDETLETIGDQTADMIAGQIAQMIAEQVAETSADGTQETIGDKTGDYEEMSSQTISEISTEMNADQSAETFKETTAEIISVTMEDSQDISVQTEDECTDPSAEVMTDSVGELIKEMVGELIAEPFCEPIDEPVGELIDEPACELPADLDIEPIVEPVVERPVDRGADANAVRIEETIPDRITKQVVEPIPDPTAQQVSEWIEDLMMRPSVQQLKEYYDLNENESASQDAQSLPVRKDSIEGALSATQDLFHELFKSGDVGSGWVMNRTRQGHKFYFNVLTMDSGWERPPQVVKDQSLLTRDEIQTIITDVTANHNRQAMFKANEPFIRQLQERCRGFLVRKWFLERLEYLEGQEEAVIIIQAYWKGYRQRKKFHDRLDYLEDHTDAIVRIQSWVRMWIARKKFLARLKHFRKNEDAIIKIQAFIKSNLARNDFKTLMYSTEPPVSVVRKYVHLLDHSDVDYTEEMELTKLRQQVVTEIRTNHKLEHDLNQMDIKIGLLVKNRITLQDVISHNKKLEDYQNKVLTASGGLKGLSRESREKLEAYQHLFYLLQTNPTYLAKLIFEMPLSKTTAFMESVILALYNYASNQREEYLLLKLFKTALEEEISSKVEKMSDITTGNPLVVKMTVDFNRNARGQSCLREILNPLVLEVIQNKDMKINTNPVEIYKTWVNQLESETGRASGMPYDVTIEQALKHKEVIVKIEKNIQELKQATDRFLCAIVKSLDKIPYGMRYIAKVMKNALHAKFPEAPEKDVLKIVGNLLYYRYINSAIVAPDAFDIITVGANNGLTNDQRRNLGSIAKILQFAASNKGYGGESEYLACLNPYIRDAHERFKQFFRSACDVEEPEIYFNIDQYTDFCLVSKPTIYISIKEIVDTHQLLLEHQDTIASDHNDPLHEILEDLGEAPDIGILVGEHGEHSDPERRDILAKTEVMLTLSNRFEVQEDDKKDQKNLLIRTKRMVVDVIRCQPGDTLAEILITPATDDQEDFHQALIKSRERTGQRADEKSEDKHNLLRDKSVLTDTMLPLESMKKKITSNLNNLEMFGITSKTDDYQTIISAIVQDIRNQRIYRVRRRQEMIKLKLTLDSLNSKRSFYEEQIDYYNQYVKTCLNNLAKNQRKSKSKSWFGSGKDHESKSKQTSLKYNAMKLYEKGIILEIDGLPENQFKNLMFEINSTNEPGIFEVHASFMGVEMDKVKVVLQDLLQLQYEGVAVYRMFNRTKVNVNLLIFLLNTKFYGK